MTTEHRICQRCKSRLSKHAPKGYCPDCSAKDINTPPPSDPDLFVATEEDIELLAGQTAGAMSPKERDTAAHLAPAGAVSIDSLGIDILLVTHEELAAIAAERQEINAALVIGPCQLSWRGVRVQPVEAEAIDRVAIAFADQGCRVARLQPGHGLHQGDPRWQQLAKQEPVKVPEYWAKTTLGRWHLYRDDVEGQEQTAACGNEGLSRPIRTETRPPEAAMCQYCWAIVCDTLVSSFNTAEVQT